MTQNSPICSRGFTLIEVMIAIALLALMGVAIAQVTIRSSEVTFSLGAESNEMVATALSIQSVEADLSQIFSPALPTGAPAPQAQEGGMQEQPKEFWSIQLRPDGLRRSRLKGSPEKLTFVANNNRRVEENAPQSEFQKITWEIQKNDQGTYSLYRSADWDAFQLDETRVRKPVRVALLENLSSARFRYYRQANKTWEENWDSENSYVLPEDRFPDLISLKMELPDPTNSSVSQTWEVTVKPNMELNAPRKKSLTTPVDPGESRRE